MVARCLCCYLCSSLDPSHSSHLMPPCMQHAGLWSFVFRYRIVIIEHPHPHPHPHRKSKRTRDHPLRRRPRKSTPLLANANKINTTFQISTTFRPCSCNWDSYTCSPLSQPRLAARMECKDSLPPYWEPWHLVLLPTPLLLFSRSDL